MNQQWYILLTTFMIGSLPSAFFFSYLGMVFWGHRVDRLTTKLLRYAMLTSAVTVGTIFYIPPAWRLVYSLTVYVIIMFLIFKELRPAGRVHLALFVYILSVCNELISSYIAFTLKITDYERLLADPRSALLLFIPFPLLAGAMAYVMNKRNIHPGKTVYDYLKRSGNKYLYWLLILLVFNTVVSFLVYTWELDNKRQIAALGMSMAMVAGLGMFFFTLRAMSLTKQAAIRSTQEAYIDDINNMFTAIRGQRHDFLNHVQVIQSLLQRQKYSELERYTKELVGEIVEINELLQIGHPAFAALIQSKMVQAMNRKIDFRYSFEGMENLKHGIASIDFVKIAGNLLDNALDEAAERPAGESWIEVKGWLDANSFNMTVRNPSRSLTEEELRLLFVPGYSTKKESEHSGLGLSIVKERVDHYQGAVDVKSIPDHGTTFVVKIPLQLKVM